MGRGGEGKMGMAGGGWKEGGGLKELSSDLQMPKIRASVFKSSDNNQK